MMPKAPTAFTRPHTLHQNLQLQAIEARPYVASCSWPTTSKRRASRPLAPLQLNVNSPYLLTKVLKPARRLPLPQLGATNFFYSSTNFFEYLKPFPKLEHSHFPDPVQGQSLTQDTTSRSIPEPCALAVSADHLIGALESRRNSSKRLRRQSPPQLESQLQAGRNTIAFPSISEAVAVVDCSDAPARKRHKPSADFQDEVKERRARDPVEFYDNFSTPSSSPPRKKKKKRSRRQRLYGRQFPARSFVPQLEVINEEVENLPPPGHRSSW